MEIREPHCVQSERRSVLEDGAPRWGSGRSSAEAGHRHLALLHHLFHRRGRTLRLYDGLQRLRTISLFHPNYFVVRVGRIVLGTQACFDYFSDTASKADFRVHHRFGPLLWIGGDVCLGSEEADQLKPAQGGPLSKQSASTCHIGEVAREDLCDEFGIHHLCARDLADGHYWLACVVDCKNWVGDPRLRHVTPRSRAEPWALALYKALWRPFLPVPVWRKPPYQSW